MTEIQDTGYGGYTHEDSIVEEDAPTVEWVDQALTDAENDGFLDELGDQVVDTYYSSPTELADLISRARETNTEQPDGEQPERTPLTREEIREKIFAKLRRPDGAPFAAGYTSGPAARKAMYAGEDTGAGWRSTQNPNSDVIKTKYDDRSTLGDRASDTDAQGRVVDDSGLPVADRQWGWVIDSETGSLLLFDPNAAVVTDVGGNQRAKRSDERLMDLLRAGYKVVATHHTTPVAGMPVTGAGLMRTAGGFITEITDESGHYRPEAPQQYAALQELMNQGYSLEQAKITLSGRSMGARPTDKADWLDEAHEENPDFPTGDVKLRPEQFMQTEGDEYQIRAKQALNEQIRARGQTPATTEGWGQNTDSDGNYQELNLGSGSIDDDDDDLSDSDSDDDDDDDDSMHAGLPPGKRRIEDPNNPGYWIVVDDVETTGEPPYEDLTPEPEQGSDTSAADTNAEFLENARSYLSTAGRSSFAEWFRTLGTEHQTLLLGDPEIARAWQTENAPQAPTWQPAEADQESAASANAAVIDGLDDRQSATFELAAFSLLIGAGHDARHVGFVQGAPDHFTGTVTVRKAALGRGAGSLTFTGVPPAKQGVVTAAVGRFSRKEVRFE